MAVEEEFLNLNEWNTDSVIIEQGLQSHRYFGAYLKDTTSNKASWLPEMQMKH